MKPGFGYTSSRVRDTERTLADTGRNPPHQGRLANPRFRRSGRHRAIVTTEITHDTPGAAKIVYWNGTGYVAALDADDAEIIVDVMGYLLNTGETVEVDTAIFIQYLDDNTCELDAGNCAVRDWTLEGE